MRIALLVEGDTEKALLPHLRAFLEPRLHGSMPRIDPIPYDGRIPTGEKLRRIVSKALEDRPRAADIVIALTDVYTGTREFTDAADAKAKMRQWVGPEPRFFPHAAQHDFEAWLLPYWPAIVSLAGSNRATPGPHPEKVDHDKPPARRLAEVFRELPAFEGDRRTVKVGLQTSDDFRFVRAWWEVPPRGILDGCAGPSWHEDLPAFQAWCRRRTLEGARWVPFAKGGEYSPFYADTGLLVGYSPADREGLKRISANDWPLKAQLLRAC